ncbi:MAG: hypothetical protein Q7S21_02190 [archaeon]|nr:hypothetical protein [archaeon]
MINMNSKGQSFAVFKLLIGAIVALAILTIIVGVIDYFDNIKIQISEKQMIDSIVSAANAPNQLVKAEKLSFSKGSSYSKKVFAQTINIEEECIILGSDGSAFNDLGNAILIENNVQADVFFRCEENAQPVTCPLECTVSFGKSIPN